MHAACNVGPHQQVCLLSVPVFLTSFLTSICPHCQCLLFHTVTGEYMEIRTSLAIYNRYLLPLGLKSQYCMLIILFLVSDSPPYNKRMTNKLQQVDATTRRGRRERKRKGTQEMSSTSLGLTREPEREY